jgi:two-component system OmpR family sensor kinase
MRFRSLQSRLLVTVVGMVALVSILIGTAAALATRANLVGQLDDQLIASADRAGHRPSGGGPLGRESRDPDDLGNQAPGTLFVLTKDGGTRGRVLGTGFGTDTSLTSEQLAALDQVGTEPTSVDVPGLGDYRVVTSTDGDLVTGLPMRGTDRAISDLVSLEIGLVLAGMLVAGGLGAIVVRRQLRPLREVAATAHEVATLPLASGEVDLATRVPERLTDEETETGQVGAALNTLLDHVESSLEARHRSEQQVRQFVADASHELRTPLATIQGYAELAAKRPETASAALEKVSAESVRMTAMVEDLLLLARLDAGRPLASEPVDLSRLLIDAVNDARVLAPDHRWRLDLPDDPLGTTGDEQRLHQVVTNLLTNARKHTPEGTTVTVRARPGVIEVHDDGPGFNPELARTAFERFTRGDAARQRAGGAGLGLSLVEAIVAAHGGSVALTSAPGDTTITVRLDRVDQQGQ